MERNHFVTNLFESMHKRAFVILVLDMSDLEGSFPLEIVEKIHSKKLKTIIVINKCDILPNSVKEPRYKHFVSQWLKSKHEMFLEYSPKNIIFVSAKDTRGMNKLIDRLKDESSTREYIGYVMGNTNVGKSSVINALKSTSKKCNYQRFTIVNPKRYKDPFDMKIAEMMKKQISNDEEEFEEERGNPTISYIPGTTLRPFKVDNMRVGCKIFDTPGLPSVSRVTDFIDDVTIYKRVLRTKNENPRNVLLDQGGAIWLGALCRIDLISGYPTEFILNVSSEVSVNRYTIEGATANYLKSRGIELSPAYSSKLENEPTFKRTSLEIHLDMNKKIHTQELAIPGLGWINFREPHKTRIPRGASIFLDIYLPTGMEPMLRNSLLNHYDIEDSQRVIRSIRKNK